MTTPEDDQKAFNPRQKKCVEEVKNNISKTNKCYFLNATSTGI